MRRIVTLTTDVGAAYAAQMKAVLYRSLRPGEVVDLSHDLPRHDIRQAAFLLRQMAVGFPPGTVHVAIVDPGVGGRRAPILIRTGDGSSLVGPDNGVLAPLAEALGRPRAYRIRRDRVPVPRLAAGTTFEGRDLFAPAAAWLALGRPVGGIGEPASFEQLLLAAPHPLLHGARGDLVHVDRFGNLVTTIPSEWLPAALAGLRVRVGSGRWRSVPFVRSYEEIGERRGLAALGSSFGTVELALRERSAAEVLQASTGTPVELDWSSRRPRPSERGK